MSQIEHMPSKCQREHSPARSGSRRSWRAPYQSRQHGTISILSAVLLIVILAFCGFALDLSRIYNRKVDVQNVAEAVALAAARKLNGTPAGINDAIAAAQLMADKFTYDYSHLPIGWAEAAITFSSTPDRNGSWAGAGAATGNAAKIFYVKVDTAQLNAALGTVDMYFMPIVMPSMTTVQVSGSAVAGRTSINVTPLAICALSSSATSQGTSASAELVEFGFRRGLSYNLMRLNPFGSGAANFVVNPFAAAGASGSATDTDAATVSPYVCTGTMASPRLIGGNVPVTSPFPLSSLYTQLNSRFDVYDGACDPVGAPPDKNIKEYSYTSIPWVTNTPLAGQSVAEYPVIGPPAQLLTKADYPLPSGSPSATDKEYGPLWAYAKAVQYAPSEPSSGYVALGTSAWPDLYAGQKHNLYPAKPPYQSTTVGPYYAAPSAAHKPWRADRRVLNVPLLSCPVAAGSNVPATVLGIGKFFMTVTATDQAVYAEFAGATPLAKVTGDVELFR